MGRSINSAKKLCVLNIIKEHKHILFASFQDNKVTKTQKEDAWTIVLEKAQSLNLVAANKKWTFARDSMYGVWKSRTLVS